MGHHVEIIAGRKQSTMSSTWTEYLCMSTTKGGLFRLFSAQYEPLAEREAFYNEDAEDYVLPDEIDGKTVAGIEDDWVVGGVLEPFDDELVVEFRWLEDEKVSQWLAANEWLQLVNLEELKSKKRQMTQTNSIAPELPEKFWKVRDAAVEHILSNSPLPVGLGDLQDWLATDGWEKLLTAWVNEDSALNLKKWANYQLSDSSLRDNEGLEVSDVITDQMRIDFAHSAISQAVELYDECDSPSVFSFPVQRDDGERAILGCTVEIHGQSGPVPMWHGVYADRPTFYSYLRKSGFLFHSESEEISDADILSFWQMEKKKRKLAK